MSEFVPPTNMKEVLERTKARLQVGWTKGTNAADPDTGKPVYEGYDPDKCLVCLDGAVLWAICGDPRGVKPGLSESPVQDFYHDVWDLFNGLLPNGTGYTVHNDNQESVIPVIELVDRGLATL